MTIGIQIGFFSALTILQILVPILRVWATGRSSFRRPSTSRLVSEVLFYISYPIGLSLAALQLEHLVRYIRWTRTYPPEMTVALVGTQEFLKRSFSVNILSLVYLWALKGAFISLYWSICPPSTEVGLPTYLIPCTAVFVGTTFIANLFFSLFSCTPIQANWESPLSCESSKVFTAYYSTHVVSDIAIFMIPISIITLLRLNRRELIALCVILAIGVVSIVTATWRFAVTLPVILSPGKASLSGVRLTPALHFLEITTSMLAFCGPAFRSWVARCKADHANSTYMENSGTDSLRNVPLSQLQGRDALQSYESASMHEQDGDSQESVGRSTTGTGSDYLAVGRGALVPNSSESAIVEAR